MIHLRTLSLAILFAGCTPTPTLNGRVVDIWGSPIEGAMVKLDGSAERPITDAHGRFAMPAGEGSATLHAGREGYIQGELQVQFTDEGARTHDDGDIVVKLYPIPSEKGFHVVGPSSYIKLQPKLIRAVGSNIESLYGIREPGRISVDGEPLRFLYHGDLRYDQLMALDVSLHRLKYVERADLTSITSTDVKLDLYVSDERTPIEISRLKSRNDYLLQTTGPLERQHIYALTTNRLLDPADDESFQRIAPALRLAFPVELR
ncbi:MAG: carboxypeptidase regulatory-like domain-containing protein [Deltaproteobacteria bacterium]|nr:MAG: carboxypeptidase regulatory-like domain-containing protein [Deltaproteobacteria bacterium]